MTIRRKTAALSAAAALTLGAGAASSADAHGRHRLPIEITSGGFRTLPGATERGYEINGGAVMLRLVHRTYVAVVVRGLDANTTYPVHVHNAPCASTPAGGGHYQHEVGGAVDSVNEIWPAITTNRNGSGHSAVTHAHRARPDAQSLIIHYPPDTSIRLACVDLA